MKWNATPVIALVAVIIFAIAAALLILAGGGDDAPASVDSETPVPNTPAAGEFGPAPRLGDNIDDLSPAHGQSVPQVSTVPLPGQPEPLGACATINFVDTPETLRWFHIAFDGELVTHLTTVFPTGQDATTGEYAGAILCYMPDEGLPVGMHTAAVSVTNPNVPSAPARQVVGWAFEVLP